MSSASTFECTNRYRQTPLRRHVTQQMGWESLKAWEQSLRDILALEDLRRSARTADQNTLRHVLNLEQFFYHSSHPDLVTYLPVKIMELEDDEQSFLDCQSPDRIAHTDLTELIRTLDRERDSSSVFLAARSGAGKTVASRKAFCDCVIPSTAGEMPLLAGYLPCWISVEAIDDFEQDQLIERLILDACHLAGKLSMSALRNWLNQSELKLLLFFDLNTWSPDARTSIAHDLPRFLNSWRDVGHRAIVAYRSSGTSDVPCEILSPKRGLFRKYDLLPLNTIEATSYLRNIREFERDVFFRAGLDLPDRDIETECLQLQSLLNLHHGDEEEGSEALISTPLLMHFSSLLGPSEFSQVRTLSDLYGQVVLLYLKRDRSKAQLAEMSSDDFEDDIDHVTVRAAMTRLAAMIIAQPEGTVSVFEKQFLNALIHPASGKRGERTWWPDAVEWHDAPWVSRKFGRSTVKILREFSLVRRDGDQIRFLHDSLIYYFVGAGACLWTNDSVWPESYMIDVPDDWPSQLIDQLDEWPGMRRVVFEFMGGSLDESRFADLVVELIVHTQDRRMPALVEALIRGADRSHEDSVPARLHKESIRRSGWRGTREPAGFASEIHSALLSQNVDACSRLASKLEKQMRERSQLWLRKTAQNQAPAAHTVCYRDTRATCLAIWVNPEDESDIRIMTGGTATSRGARIEVWNPQTGEVNRSSFLRSTRQIVALDSSRVVFTGGRGAVGLWNLTGDECIELLEDGSEVTCLQLLHDQLLVGDDHGVLQLVCPRTGDRKRLVEHNCGVSCLMVCTDNRIIYGDRDGGVFLWSPECGCEEISRHRGKVACLAESTNGSILSGGDDGYVRKWTMRGSLFGDCIGLSDVVIRIRGRVRSLETTSSGFYCTGTVRAERNRQSYVLYRWNTDSGLTEFSRSDSELYAIVSDDSAAIIDADRRTVLLKQAGSQCVAIPHDSRVTCLTAIPNKFLASAADDGSLKLWWPSEESHGLQKPVDAITYLAATADQHVLALSARGILKRIDPLSQASEIVAELPETAGVVATMPNGDFVFAKPNAVVLWESASRTCREIIHHKEKVTCLNVLGTDVVVAGYRDGSVLMRNVSPDARKWKVILRHSERAQRRHHPHYPNGPPRLDLRAVTCLLTTQDGCVYSAGMDGLVSRWDSISGDVSNVATHASPVSWLQEHSEERVSSGREVWVHSHGMITDRDVLRVTCRCILADGRHAVAGKSWPRTIALTNPSGRGMTAVFFTESDVTCLFAPPESPYFLAGLANGDVLTVFVEPAPTDFSIVSYATANIRLR